MFDLASLGCDLALLVFGEVSSAVGLVLLVESQADQIVIFLSGVGSYYVVFHHFGV